MKVHSVECITDINMESHNLVQNIPHEISNGGSLTQRTMLNVNSQIAEIPFPFIYLFILIFFHNKWTSKALFFFGGGGGGGGGPDVPIAPPPYGPAV